MTEHDVFVATKGYLLNHGWKQGGYGRHGGPRCLVGATASAVRLTNVSASSSETRPSPMRHALGRLARVIGYAPSYFNDDEWRTLDDVIAVLDECILATAPETVDEPEPEPALA